MVWLTVTLRLTIPTTTSDASSIRRRHREHVTSEPGTCGTPLTLARPPRTRARWRSSARVMPTVEQMFGSPESGSGPLPGGSHPCGYLPEGLTHFEGEPDPHARPNPRCSTGPPGRRGQLPGAVQEPCSKLATLQTPEVTASRGSLNPSYLHFWAEGVTMRSCDRLDASLSRTYRRDIALCNHHESCAHPGGESSLRNLSRSATRSVRSHLSGMA